MYSIHDCLSLHLSILLHTHIGGARLELDPDVALDVVGGDDVDVDDGGRVVVDHVVAGVVPDLDLHVGRVEGEAGTLRAWGREGEKRIRSAE